MIIGEEMQQSTNPYPAAQLIAAYAQPQTFAEQATMRSERYARLYPKLKRGALIAGIVVPIAFVLTFSLTTGTKLIALAAWVILVLLAIAFLMTIEMMRGSVQRQLELGNKQPDELHQLLNEYARNRLSVSDPRLNIVIHDHDHFIWNDAQTEDIPVVGGNAHGSDDENRDGGDEFDATREAEQTPSTPPRPPSAARNSTDADVAADTADTADTADATDATDADSPADAADTADTENAASSPEDTADGREDTQDLSGQETP